MSHASPKGASAALINRDKLDFPTWGKGNSAKRDVRSGEVALEHQVSQVVGNMSFLWLPIDDEAGPKSLRRYVERNSIKMAWAAWSSGSSPASGLAFVFGAGGMTVSAATKLRLLIALHSAPADRPTNFSTSPFPRQFGSLWITPFSRLVWI